MAEYDLIIRNGHVVDGSGGKSGILDVAVKDGLIQAVGENLPDTALNEIDAAGLIVTPGFVDVHTHYDGQATWDSHLNPSSNLGTTTVVMGNCGVGFAPCKPEDRDVLIQLMEGVEEIPETAMAEGLPWTWESFPEYLDTLDAKPRDIDVAALVPHGPVRVFVMGERAVNRETATDEDISKMQAVIEESVNAGGVGFSTSRTLVHRTSTGSPVPTYKAATHELKQLGLALSGEKGHVFQLISDWEDLDEEFSILRSTSESTGAKGTFTLLHLDNQPDLWRQQLDHIEHAQSEGLDIRGQVLSRPVGMLMGHPASMSPFSPRPTFRSLEDLPWNEKIAKLKTPEIKSQILGEDIDQPHIFVKLFSRRFDKMYPLEEPIEYLPAPDTSVAARAQAEGVEPVEWLYDYFLGNNGNNLIYIPAANFSDHIPELLTHPNTVSALGDGGAHVGSICDASANIYVITKWVKERKSFELEKAIHLLTRQPAELYSLKDRGLIAPGYKADINLIDYEALSLKTPHIVHDLPAGGKRLLQHANGIVSTMVSGTVIYQSGEATGALPGKLVRGQQQDPVNSATAQG
ncbi:MAG: amidohydrolase family protein [Gammaproteobacteria bacterium]|jgi:N-acyl-D-amino-acid deacylase|nr:amidohydrolase family protein [Gammaproteobacteria bacterium]MBT7539174.1 amidohydrolase family protein [Gammaproteobacteria bacterium]